MIPMLAVLLLASDFTGSYVARSKGEVEGTLQVLQAGDRMVLVFDQIWGQQTCDCVAEASPAGPDHWSLKGEFFDGALDSKNGVLAITAKGSPDCCGANWPGAPAYAMAKKKGIAVDRCVAKEPKTFFYDSAGEAKKAFVIAGDKVEIFPPIAGNLVPARFYGKKPVVGFLKLKQLDCEE